MHEHPLDVDDEQLDAPRPEPTGHDAVDEVLSAVADLSDRPLEEHAAVFEEAHGRLRRALDAPA